MKSVTSTCIYTYEDLVIAQETGKQLWLCVQIPLPGCSAYDVENPGCFRAANGSLNCFNLFDSDCQ